MSLASRILGGLRPPQPVNEKGDNNMASKNADQLNTLLDKVNALHLGLQAENQALAAKVDQIVANQTAIARKNGQGQERNMVVELPAELKGLRYGPKTVFIPGVMVTGVKDATGRYAGLVHKIVTLRLGAIRKETPDGFTFERPAVLGRDRLAVLVQQATIQTYFTGEEEVVVNASYADRIAQFNPATNLHEAVKPRQNVFAGFVVLNATGQLAQQRPEKAVESVKTL